MTRLLRLSQPEDDDRWMFGSSGTPVNEEQTPRIFARRSMATAKPVPPGGERCDCFADEIAIDFPSVDADRIRHAFLAGDGVHEPVDELSTEIQLSFRQACDGTVIPLDVPVRGTCPRCGGRGETWSDPCPRCGGTGLATFRHRVRVSLPARTADGTSYSFRLSTPHAPPMRIELRIAIRA